MGQGTQLAAAAREQLHRSARHDRGRAIEALGGCGPGTGRSIAHELFLAGDVRVAASDTVFNQGEVFGGVFPGGGGTVRCVREAGWANAMSYMLSGESWSAEE